MTQSPSRRRPAGFARSAGFTLVELMFVVAILGVVVAGITKAVIDLYRTANVRNLNVAMQGEGRDGLHLLERDLRGASLGSTLGAIWTQDTLGTVIQRPAVQIFDNLSGANANLDVKAGTDAVLVVRADFSGAEGAAVGTQYNSPTGVNVTSTAGFAVGQPLLLGPYQQAAWDRVGAIAAGSLGLTSTQNVFPKGLLASGSMVRSARATLFYVSAADELVSVRLLVPRAPGTAAEMDARDVLARGVENLQVDCQTDTGMAIGACPAALGGGDPIAAESTWAFGAWPAGGGPRLNAVTVAALRNVILQVVVRSQRPLADSRGDDKIAIGNQAALPVGGGLSDADPFLRRSYRLLIAVRNVSLGAF